MSKAKLAHSRQWLHITLVAKDGVEFTLINGDIRENYEDYLLIEQVTTTSLTLDSPNHSLSSVAINNNNTTIAASSFSNLRSYLASFNEFVLQTAPLTLLLKLIY